MIKIKKVYELYPNIMPFSTINRLLSCLISIKQPSDTVSNGLAKLVIFIDTNFNLWHCYEMIIFASGKAKSIEKTEFTRDVNEYFERDFNVAWSENWRFVAMVEGVSAHG